MTSLNLDKTTARGVLSVGVSSPIPWAEVSGRERVQAAGEPRPAYNPAGAERQCAPGAPAVVCR
jgi:hypothetical protein